MSHPSPLFLGNNDSDTEIEMDDTEENSVDLVPELDLTDGEIEEPTEYDNEFINDNEIIVDAETTTRQTQKRVKTILIRNKSLIRNYD